MKIVNIIGGLGNQMFQYALVVALHNKFQERVYVDTTMFDTYKVHNGLELTRIFDVTLFPASKSDLRRLTRFTKHFKLRRAYRKFLPPKKTECLEAKDYTYNESVLTDDSDRYYDGYWQNWQYFERYADQIRAIYRFKLPLSGQNQILLAKLQNSTNSVSIHIRRGDYLKAKNYAGLCGLEYYVNAITYIRTRLNGKIHFLVFSDDMDWCQQYISPLLKNDQQTYVDWNRGANSYIDMQLMSECCHNIIANSSFSWWAAWLNAHDDKIVVAPQKWTNTKINCRFQMPEWILF